MNPTLAKMLAEVDERPDDWDLRLIAADCAEDSGEHGVALGLRWTARNRKRPFNSGVYGVGTVHWYNENTNSRTRPVDIQSDLPRDLYALLTGGENRGWGTVYGTNREAEEDLYRALLRA